MARIAAPTPAAKICAVAEPRSFVEAIGEIRQQLATGELGFVASAVTPWHALGVDAWIHRLRADGDTRNGVILLVPQFKDGLLITPANLPAASADSRNRILAVGGHLAGSPGALLRQVSSLALRALRLLAARRPVGRGPSFKLAFPRVPDVFTLLHVYRDLNRSGSGLEFVLLDEGLATYMPQGLFDRVRKRDRAAAKGNRLVRRVDPLLRATYSRAHGVISRKYPQQVRFLFHKDANGRLSIDDSVASDYREVIRRQQAGGEPVFETDRPAAVLMPQPWTEYGQIEAAAERAFVEQLVEGLERAGYQTYLKPHPREAPGKYTAVAAASGCRLLAQDLPVERLFPCLRPGDIVVGHNTTALLTAAALYDVEAYSMAPALLETADTGAVFREMQIEFSKLAGARVKDVREVVN